MPLKIATWNINSVRLRIGLVEAFLKEKEIDILCLQEIKCNTDAFPSKAFHQMGYPYIAVNGQKGYHGVAIISRVELKNIERVFFCNEDARHISASVDFNNMLLKIHNFYVPAGGDVPDIELNDKFKHKLDYLQAMDEHLKEDTEQPSFLVGDLNIAPLEHDVWSHKQLLKVVSHTPIETDLLNRVQHSGNWQDIGRHFVPSDEKLFTWWSYRSPNWAVSNKGRRLDHIWSRNIPKTALRDFYIHTEARGFVKPSDHVPVMVSLGNTS